MRCVVAACAAVVLAACERQENAPKPRPEEKPAPGARAAADGRELFREHCAVCHGEDGKGAGPAAEYLFPRPRDLTSGSFKLRSTPTGDLPTDDDLRRVIQRGIPGSSMPSFAHLKGEQIDALVETVKGFANIEMEGETVNLFKVRPPSRVIRPGAAPPPTPELVAKGRKVYERMGCASCHGERGEGDGPSAPGLKDEWGWPNPPANFTRGIFKGGDAVEDIYLRFTTGMTGSPMPSYEKQLSDEERWALSHYVKSLVRQDEPPLVHKSEAVIRAGRSDRIPLEPDAPEWRRTPGEEISLLLLWQRAHAPNYVNVRALRGETEIGVRLEWRDATADAAPLRSQDYGDMAAVMFPLTEPRGDFSMGSADRPGNIWLWKFSRQLDLTEFRDVEARYPNMVSDDYLFAKPYYPKTPEFTPHIPVPPAPVHDRTYLSGWGAGNIVSDARPQSAVEDLLARGFGTLEAQPPEEQNVEGRGIWRDGRWAVVFRRSLAGRGPDFSFEGRDRAYIAFAVWDGSAGDRDGKKLVTYWQVLQLR